MSFTLTSSGAILMKAGENADSTATSSGALIREFCDQAEGLICSTTRVDWVSKYSSLNANFKKILDSTASSWAAMHIVKYNLASFYSLAEAQTMLNVLYDDFNRNLNLLQKEAEVRRAVGAS